MVLRNELSNELLCLNEPLLFHFIVFIIQFFRTAIFENYYIVFRFWLKLIITIFLMLICKRIEKYSFPLEECVGRIDWKTMILRKFNHTNSPDWFLFQKELHYRYTLSFETPMFNKVLNNCIWESQLTRQKRLELGKNNFTWNSFVFFFSTAN